MGTWPAAGMGCWSLRKVNKYKSKMLGGTPGPDTAASRERIAINVRHKWTLSPAKAVSEGGSMARKGTLALLDPSARPVGPAIKMTRDGEQNGQGWRG